jgi:hypothetical protein
MTELFLGLLHLQECCSFYRTQVKKNLKDCRLSESLENSLNVLYNCGGKVGGARETHQCSPSTDPWLLFDNGTSYEWTIVNTS